MREVRSIHLKPEYSLVWENGKVFIEDMDVLDEFIALTLANLQPPLALMVVNELIIELTGTTKLEFIAALNRSNKMFSGAYKIGDLVKGSLVNISSLLFFMTRVRGDILGDNQILPGRIQEWLSREPLGNWPQHNYPLSDVLESMAINSNTASSVLDQLARRKDAPFLYGIVAQNPNTANHTLEYILRFEYIPDLKPQSYDAAVSNWKGPFPENLALEVLEKRVASLDVCLAAKHIDESIQLLLAPSPYSWVREALKNNPHLSDKARDVILQNEENEV